MSEDTIKKLHDSYRRYDATTRDQWEIVGLFLMYTEGELMTRHQRAKYQARVRENQKRKLLRTLKKYKRRKTTYLV